MSFRNGLIPTPVEEVVSKLERMSSVVASPNRRYPENPIVPYITEQRRRERRTALVMSEDLLISARIGCTLKWKVKAMTMTGTTVKRSKKGRFLSGRSLRVWIAPRVRAFTAITEVITTKTTARKTETAELNRRESEGKFVGIPGVR